MKTSIWRGCYDKQLTGFIVPEAFAHPAKFSLGLVERIYDHMLKERWICRGDRVGDPFGGVGIGGLVAAYRKLEWIGVELEPKFVALAKENFHEHSFRLGFLNAPWPRIIQGDSRNFAERVAGVVSSPPYAQSLRTLNNNGIDPAKLDTTKNATGKRSMLHLKESYGKEPGQIEKLSEGTLAAAVSSPPYAESNQDYKSGWQYLDKEKMAKSSHVRAGRYHESNYGETPWQIGGLKACVSSPPYAAISAGAGGLNTKPAKKPGQQAGRSAKASSQTADQKYGDTQGQISQLSAIATSPPWESNCEGSRRKGRFKNQQAILKSKRGNGASDAAVLAQAERDDQKTYGTTKGNIGNTRKETYWDAMKQVYQQCFLAIKPGGYIAIVVKDYVKDRKIVPLCDDTAKLLEHVGFEIVERAHAMLSETTEHADLFEGKTVTTRERKSFFRRLYESKGGPRIDFEVVIFGRKP